MCTWYVLKDNEISKDIVDNYRTMFESRISAGATEELPCSENLRISSWSHDMEGHAKKCVERYCELANRTTQQLYKVSTPCIDDHHFKQEELKSVGQLSNVCSQIVITCLYLVRIGRLDTLWSVNKLSRSSTKWTKACDKRLCRLISYIHHTCEYKQCCHVGNTDKQCRLGLFQDSDFAGDLEDSKSTSGGTLCVFGSHTFVPISWMCKKQTSVSHSSTESKIISLDAGLRLDGVPALDLLLGLFLAYALYTRGIWKGDVLVADIEELETMDASEIYSTRLNAKEVMTQCKGSNISHLDTGNTQFEEKVT